MRDRTGQHIDLGKNANKSENRSASSSSRSGHHLESSIHVILLSLLALSALLALSCASKDQYIKPPVEFGRSFSADGSAPLADRWWEAFEDTRLNAIVEESLQDNFSLKAAWDRLDQAWATASKNGADMWPSVQGSAGYSRTVTKVAGLERAYLTQYGLGIVASYELDLWGKVRATRDASRFDALASQEALLTAAITLTAEVVNTWHRLIEQNGQMKLLEAQMKTNEDYLEVITLQFRRGISSATDVLQQQQLVESNKGEIIQVKSNIEVLRNQLAVLVGKSPQDEAFEIPQTLSDVPDMPKIGAVADWLRRRPDVRAAELAVRSADKRAAAALADRFPSISLSVGADTSAEEIRDLFDNWAASLAANLVAPLFDGNRRLAESKRTRFAAQEEMNNYAQLVLESLKEVEDALVNEASQAEYVRSLEKQLLLSEKATQQSRENYTKGGIDFTRYLTTLLSHQKLQRTYLSTVRERLDYRVSLYRAIAGSWELSRPNTNVNDNDARPVDDSESTETTK
ncbi:MAG: TolC family protein [Candidatus Coatesbacteria bacterium]|nr:TolC family protein [Candidatus Coatesbacteria bacterium]